MAPSSLICIAFILCVSNAQPYFNNPGNGNGNGNGNSNGNGNGNGCNGQGNPNCNDDTTTTTTTSTTTSTSTTTTTLPTTTTTSAATTSVATSIETTTETFDTIEPITSSEPELTFFETFDSTSDDDCPDKCYDGVIFPNFCDYASYQWDDESVPLDERNNIGRARLLSEDNVLAAAELITSGKVYKLAYPKTNTMPAFGTRAWYTSLRYPDPPFGDKSDFYEFQRETEECGVGFGYLDQRLMTSANGNSGTQFDGLGHAFYMNGEYGDVAHYLFHNGFTGVDVMRESGVQYIGIEQLPPFITRAILLDVAGYEGVDVLDSTYFIDSNVIENTLIYQGMKLDDIKEGDVILLHTGYAAANWFGDSASYYLDIAGFALETVINIFGPKGVLMLGADQWAVEGVSFIGNTYSGSFPLHAHWILCNGGFLYENMKLDEWAIDARNDDAPYIGGFYFVPAQIEGAVGGLGTPMVIV